MIDQMMSFSRDAPELDELYTYCYCDWWMDRLVPDVEWIGKPGK